MLVTPENFAASVAELESASEIGLDTETTGLRWQDRPFSIIFATAREVFYFNFQNYPGVGGIPYSKTHELQGIFREGARFYISNAKFDMRMLRHLGLEMRGEFYCTNAQGRVWKNNLIGKNPYGLEAFGKLLGDHKADAVAEYITKNRLYTMEEIPGKKKKYANKRFWEVPIEIMQPYAEQDAKLHLRAGKFLEAEIGKLQNTMVSAQPTAISANELKLTKVCHDMEWAGIAIDRPYIEKAIAFENGEIAKAKQDFQAHSGGRAFIDSNKFLFETFTACDYTDLPKTAKGNPSFNDDTLEEIEGPLAESVRNIRHHEKRLGTYYSSFLYYQVDGVIHADMKQGGTETGRFSYANPNLQNLPKEEGATHENNPSIVRASFTPRPGFVYIIIDYSQQEYRLMLDYAGEHLLIDQINQGADVHQAMAELVGITRQQAKTLNFAILYGAGVEKIARMLGVSIREATALRALYFRKLPKVKLFIEKVIEKGKARGFVVNWAGRRCAISNREWAYILPNHLIQGGGADVIKFAMPEVHAVLAPTKSQMILQVHDELLFEMHADDLHLIPRIQGIMEGIYKPQNGMRLTTAIEHSYKSYGYPDKVKGLPS